MSLVASLPGRPLTDAEVASLNRADAVELAVAVDPAGEGADGSDDGRADDDGREDDDGRKSEDDGRGEPAPGGAGAPDGAEALLLATDSWVKGLDFLGGAWEVVETVPVEGEDDRYDALRACEDAVRASRDP